MQTNPLGSITPIMSMRSKFEKAPKGKEQNNSWSDPLKVYTDRAQKHARIGCDALLRWGSGAIKCLRRFGKRFPQTPSETATGIQFSAPNSHVFHCAMADILDQKNSPAVGLLPKRNSNIRLIQPKTRMHNLRVKKISAPGQPHV
jgi:hypothetical protein